MTVPDPDLMSWESEGSGESLEEWSLISGQVFSKLIRHYRRRLRSVILAKGDKGYE